MGANRSRVWIVVGGMVIAGIFLMRSGGTTAQPPAEKQATSPAKGPTVQDVALFEKDVLPILKANCYKCHGDDKIRGGLTLTSRETILKGGERGPAVSLTKPDDSWIVKAINHKDELAMPPSPAAKLSQSDIDILSRWVKAGVPGLPEKAIATPGKGERITAEDRAYWAYQPVKRPEPPTVKNKDWVRNPIDAFVLAGMEAKGLSPAPPADRHTLGRRVYYDLIGLPPTPEELDAFVNDNHPDAYERLVDKLLASPHYGEKWARHWLDLVRFGETNGFEFDQPKPMIWRYRDYVIDSFNKDKPYDQFVREQIAGDQMKPVTPEGLIATGYYRLGQWDSGAADRTLQKYEVLDSIISTTGQVFLGMSIGCARCHDHKADPILQRDYYKLMAFFHNISDFGAKNTRNIMAAADGISQAKALKEKQDREIDLARQIYQLEQRFAVALSTKKGFRITDLPPSDLIEMNYRFFRDTWEKLPDFEVLQNEGEGPIAHNYMTLAPAKHTDAMGFVFEGKLKVLAEGDYTFFLESTDGARIIVDGKTVLDRPNKGKQTGSAKTGLKAGLLSFRLEYFNTYDKPYLKVEWAGPGVDRRPLTDDGKRDMIDLDALIREHGVEALGDKETKQYLKLTGDLDNSRKIKPAQVGIQVSAIVETGNAPTHLLIRGNPQAKGDRVDPGFPEILIKGKPEPVKGGRLALANWLTDPENPLTARVMANRLWQHHFGRGLVPSPNDFGKFGEGVTHPVLLDWLATEFVAKGWKIKQMHRMLMTSSTYRMSSKANDKALAVDPGNLLFWRYNMRRLSAEEIRDSMLMISGKLNVKMGGPSVLPTIPREVLAGQARPGEGWKVTKDANEHNRRSIYVYVKRSLLLPILAQFDLADTDASCPVRFTTTVATQALGLINGEFGNDQAKVLAERLEKDAPKKLDAQVAKAIRLTTGRVPSAEEIRKDVDFINNLRQRNNLSEAGALRYYCLMMLSTNEFVYLD